jgi:hypothetical protein
MKKEKDQGGPRHMSEKSHHPAQLRLHLKPTHHLIATPGETLTLKHAVDPN